MELLARSGYDEDHAAFRESVRRFVAAEIVPHLDQWRASDGAPAELYAALGAQGFLGVAVPEEYGGGGVDDPRFAGVLVEEVAASGALGIAAVLAHHCGVAIPALLRLPDTAQRAAWLRGAAAGTGLAVLTSIRDGRAGAVLGGHRADLFVVLGGEGAVAVSVDDAEATQASLLGCPDVGAGELVLAQPSAGVALPAAALLQADASLWSAIAMLAGARATYLITVEYVQQRRVFGRPLSSFENTAHRLAEIGAELVAASALVERCLDEDDEGIRASAAAAAVLVAQQVHTRAVDQGLQLHGGYGYMREYPIAHAFADARQVHLACAALNDPRSRLAAAAGLCPDGAGPGSAR